MENGEPKYHGRRRESLVVRTLETLTTRRYSEVDETRRLEREIALENLRPPRSRINKVRHKGGLLLHTKQVLLAVVLLNLVDCALVLGELILDIHYIKGLVEKMDEETSAFIVKMEQKYPEHLRDNDIDHINQMFQQIVDASCVFSNNPNDFFDFETSSAHYDDTADAQPQTTQAALFKSRRLFQDGVTEAMTDGQENNETLTIFRPSKMPHSDSFWEKLAHGLHKASITILGILFVENILKVFFMGKKFLSNKLEVFDFVIVAASFVLDLVFLKGLTVYRIQDGILILSFLVPWRVIRVVNSLIVAVLDHEHFRIKMMYKKQKTISSELKDMKKMEKDMQLHLKRVEQFCQQEGVPQWKITQHIQFRRNNSAISTMASYALGSMLTGIMGNHAKTADKPDTKPDKYNMKNHWKSFDSSASQDSGRWSISEVPERSDDEVSSHSSKKSSTSSKGSADSSNESLYSSKTESLDSSKKEGLDSNKKESLDSSHTSLPNISEDSDSTNGSLHASEKGSDSRNASPCSSKKIPHTANGGVKNTSNCHVKREERSDDRDPELGDIGAVNGAYEDDDNITDNTRL